MSLIVKICGLSTEETLDAALGAGADMVGFVFFAPSPRHIDLATMAGLANHARGRAEIVILTVDAEKTQLAEIADRVRPDWFQFHGKETPEFVSATRQALGIPAMKALPIANRDDLDPVDRYAAVADRILFDARPPKGATRPGGLGVPFDWTLLRDLNLSKPFMVSGGLHKGNVAEAIRVTRPQGVDVSSGVERASGIKDVGMIRDFIRVAREAEHDILPSVSNG
jgi:phosphoribosylanthranilate isomerase